MMVVLTHAFGHSYVDGVGYSVIQAIFDQRHDGGGPACAPVPAQDARHYHKPRLRRLGRHLFALAFSRRDAGRGLRLGMGILLPNAGLTLPSAAIIGMAAMVGAGTGGVMTAIIMVFEMTRDYAIIVPVIVAVALAAGVRRALITETIYTIKLRHRGHRIPKERHINLYLVQQAQDIMERGSLSRSAGSTLRDASAGKTSTMCVPSWSSGTGGSSDLIPPRSGIWRRGTYQSGRSGGEVRREPARGLPRPAIF